MSNYWDNKSKDYWDSKIAAAGMPVDQTASGLQQFLVNTYTWMMFGLVLTALVAVVVSSSPSLLYYVLGTPLFWVLIFAELGLVIWFGVSLAKGASATKLITMFLVYAALNGVVLSSIFVAYALGTIAKAFFVSAGMFGGMSVYGYVTKRDLTGIGNFARMGLFGLILAMLVNFFLKSPAIDYMLSFIGVGIFVVLTAYDVQKLKRYYHHHAQNYEGLKRMAVGGALMLYLDFINLFLFVLRIFGGRR